MTSKEAIKIEQCLLNLSCNFHHLNCLLLLSMSLLLVSMHVSNCMHFILQIRMTAKEAMKIEQCLLNLSCNFHHLKFHLNCLLLLSISLLLVRIR